MSNKSNEVDQAFADDLGDVDFKSRFDDPPEPAAAEDDKDAEGPVTTANEGAGEEEDRTSDAARSSQQPPAEANDRKALTPEQTSSKDIEEPDIPTRPVELDPNQTINQDGYIRERPTHYLRPDQMKSLRVSKAMRDSPFGRTMTEIATAVFDLFGFGVESDREAHDNYGYPEEDILGRLIPEDQWNELIATARSREGSHASRKAIMYRVSRLIEDALRDADYGDGRKRRSK